jgi:hypothetical protein
VSDIAVIAENFPLNMMGKVLRKGLGRIFLYAYP